MNKLLIVLLVLVIALAADTARAGSSTLPPVAQVAPPVECTTAVSVLLDVSGSVTSVLDPARMKKAMRAAVKVHPFRKTGACLSLYAFATTASRVLAFTNVTTPEGQAAVLAAIDALVFETAYPHYYTNWEAGLAMVLATQTQWPLHKSDQVYLITDGLPTTRTAGCPNPAQTHQPCDGSDQNVAAAAAVSKQLVALGTAVVGVSVGTVVADGPLEAISGPCPDPPVRCAVGVHFYHAASLEGLGETVAGSIRQRMGESAVDTDTTTGEVGTTAAPAAARLPPSIATAEPDPTTPKPTTTTTPKPTTKPTPAQKTPATSSNRPTTKIAPQTNARSPPTPAASSLAHTRDEVHTDAWIIPVILGGGLAIAVILGLALACMLSRPTPMSYYPRRVQRAEQGRDEDDDVESRIPIASSRPSLVPPRRGAGRR